MTCVCCTHNTTHTIRREESLNVVSASTIRTSTSTLWASAARRNNGLCKMAYNSVKSRRDVPYKILAIRILHITYYILQNTYYISHPCAESPMYSRSMRNESSRILDRLPVQILILRPLLQVSAAFYSPNILPGVILPPLNQLSHGENDNCCHHRTGSVDVSILRVI